MWLKYRRIQEVTDGSDLNPLKILSQTDPNELKPDFTQTSAKQT